MIKKIFILFGMCFLVAALYFYYSNPRGAWQWETAGKRQYETKRQFNALGSTQAIIKKIQTKVDNNPRDAQGWYLLGKLYLSNGQYQESSSAMEKAYQLKKDNPNIRFNYAKILFALGKLNKAGKLINENLTARSVQEDYYLAGVIAYARKDYAKATDCWQYILDNLKPQPDEYTAISEAISKTKKEHI